MENRCWFGKLDYFCGQIWNEAGLPEPTFVSEQGAVVVTIKYQKKADGELNGELNNSQRRTFEFVKSHLGCTAAEISEQLGVPFSTIDKHIRVLIAKGLIERRGSKKTGGYYAQNLNNKIN